MNPAKERRKHQRFEAVNNILAINSLSFGQVVNLSMGGLRIKYLLHRNDPFQQAFEIGLLNNVGDTYLEKLPCQVVSAIDSSLPDLPRNLFVREVGVMFTDLNSHQINMLAEFVLHNTLVMA
jgi:hypothetical protein